MRFALNGAQAYQDYKNAHSIRLSSWIDLDYDMPVMNGMDSGKLIRKFEPRKDLSPSIIIMISGHCDDELIKRCSDRDGEVGLIISLRSLFLFEQIHSIYSYLLKCPIWTLKFGKC